MVQVGMSIDDGLGFKSVFLYRINELFQFTAGINKKGLILIFLPNDIGVLLKRPCHEPDNIQIQILLKKRCERHCILSV